MARRRAVITGIGCVTPIGIGREAFWEGLRRQRSAVRPLDRFDASAMRSRIAAHVDDFAPERWIPARRVRRFDRYSQFAVAAAALALADAGLLRSPPGGEPLLDDDLLPERCGVEMGSALGGIGYAEEQYGSYLAGGLRAVDPNLALTVFGGAASCNIAIMFGLTGPNQTNAMSCASGAIAIGNALRAIRSGAADMMLAGGAEAPLTPLCYGAFALIRAMSTRNDDPATACRPFDAERDGFVMGEGAAVLVIEELGRARARGAHVYAELLGFGLTNDAHHMTAPRPDGRCAAEAMRLALADAGLPPEAIEYVNAHGSSTPLNDAAEALAIRSVFGRRADRIPVSGTKAYYGHPLGASGAIEAAVTALTLDRGWLPPTLNLTRPDPACDLDCVPNLGRPAQVSHALSNSFGFGGVNAVLVLGRPDA